ncbi:PIR Superfamily Protein [Plasmodium ovale wallikeri]|uniref:PIR Superfamily Protein n=1 Tax=Plasmodium ovale wallikeri TaxID=864142 RepID=A0A1A9ASV6_PLAOA|nr:PIR Superfamily Protein [Plasmodium ovale wallikeri]SBT59329.1 PIR Superfamily Protein [Plasmodium ovale wallikeri]
MKPEYTDPDLRDLPSNIIYYKLDKALKENFYDDSTYWNYYIKNTYVKLSSISDSLVNTFYYVVNMKSINTFYDERWNYAFFWLGNKLLENSESSIFEKVMSVLQTLRSGLVGTKDKYNDDMFAVDKRHFPDLKRMYDYLQNYRSIIAKIGYIDAPCTALYKDYVSTTFNFYKEEKEKCFQKDTDNYCKVVNRFLREYVNEIKELTCTGKTSPEKPAAEDLKNSISERSSTGYDGQGVHSPLGQDGEARGMSHLDGDISPSSGSTNALSTVFPLLGTASLAFFFLKFTPIGSRLRSSIFRKHILQSNEEEEAQEILENSYEFAPTNMEDTAHNIAYHSM